MTLLSFSVLTTNLSASYFLKPSNIFYLHEQVVLLDQDLTPDQELPVTFLIASLLSQVWNCRIGKKPCNIVNVRANLEASIQILRKSRHFTAAIKLGEIMML